ncbi:MAG: transglutaminase family protein [Planctomycetaceae bacterium]|nr:transglutaminase family protein [Planctomycetaceae bacterium]
MNDIELLTTFEDCSLSVEEWTHRAHLRVAWLYCCRNDLATATSQIRRAIQAYNTAKGTPEAVDRGYHETITRAFMTLVFAAEVQTGPHESSDQFCDTHGELLTKLALRRYYSSERIMTQQAKAQFVEPDIADLPRIPDSLAASELRRFLAADEVIDWGHPTIVELANRLTTGLRDDEAIARHLFEWVRDQIQHSMDFGRDEITCTASDVLRLGTGFCFGKSHLLAALLRASGIPVGFCYQRLSINDKGPPCCLHGFNAVYLARYGWYRLDPRGNTATIHAAFSPPVERLAFQPALECEADLPEIHAAPLPVVISVLNSCESASEFAGNLYQTVESHSSTASL